jgi:ATP-dependent DNA helicase RecG
VTVSRRERDADLAEIVRVLRSRGTDLTKVEVKASGGGLPRSLAETISAFSNGSGGTVILGLDERAGFTPAAGFDARKMRDDLASLCADAVRPPVRADIDIIEVDGAPVVVADIPELDPRRKPCHVTRQGEYNGSYIRGGDGDRRLTEYEINLLHANQGQPRDDVEAVPEATMEDLDPDAVARLLRRVRAREPAAFRAITDDVALERLRVLRKDGGRLVPTLAGLLVLGSYPQQFFPQLNATFIAIPSTAKDRIPADGPRFLDNRALNGAIPDIVEGAVTAAIRNMSVRGQVFGVGREDTYDYPVEALREAVTNALMHRDYSPHSRGTQVQIEMYLDRVEVRNPGGLFGTVTQSDLGREGTSSSRNPHLARLLQDVPLPGTDQVVCENRGTGIPTMVHELRRAGMKPPRFDNKVARFMVTFPKYALLDADTRRWIAGLGQDGLSDGQHMALALMRHQGSVTNGMLRGQGVERHEATAALADLVGRGLALKFNGRRYAEYRLLDEVVDQYLEDYPRLAAAAAAGRPTEDRLAAIDGLFDDAPVLRAADVQARTGLKPAMVRRYLSRLIDAGRIEATAPPQSRARAYRRKAAG